MSRANASGRLRQRRCASFAIQHAAAIYANIYPENSEEEKNRSNPMERFCIACLGRGFGILSPQPVFWYHLYTGC
jgi:hypothetical protein